MRTLMLTIVFLAVPLPIFAEGIMPVGWVRFESVVCEGEPRVLGQTCIATDHSGKVLVRTMPNGKVVAVIKPDTVLYNFEHTKDYKWIFVGISDYTDKGPCSFTAEDANPTLLSCLPVESDK